MAKSSTSFKKGDVGNPRGRAPLTPEQRLARELRAKLQPELVGILASIARSEGAEPKDRIAAAKALLDEAPKETTVSVEAIEPRPQLQALPDDKFDVMTEAVSEAAAPQH